MGIPSHSFYKKKSAKVYTLTRRDQVVADLLASAQDLEAPVRDLALSGNALARQVAADPQNAKDGLQMAVRAFPQTETVLQSLVRSEGLTFWGEAIELVLALCATHPALAPCEGVMDGAPALLFSRGGDNRGGFDSPRPSRSILVGLSPWSLAWTLSQAARVNVAPAKMAAAILYRHARPVAAFIQAAHRDV